MDSRGAGVAHHAHDLIFEGGDAHQRIVDQDDPLAPIAARLTMLQRTRVRARSGRLDAGAADIVIA